MNAAVKEVLQKVERWPEEDQVELAELARAIEARRSGVYALSDEERAAIADARRLRLGRRGGRVLEASRHSMKVRYRAPWFALILM